MPAKLNSLMYHDILLSGSGSRYCFTLAEFREHLRAIEARVEGAPAAVGREERMSRFALTFDDGCAGWLAAAEELLSRRWTAHFFVITGVIGKPGKLARGDIRRLAGMGHVIGTHSVDHPAHFSFREEPYIRRQWGESKAALEDILGNEVSAASVPGGCYRRKVARAAEETGLFELFTSEPVADSWLVGRCRVRGRYALTRGMTSRTVARLAAGEGAAAAGSYLRWNLKKAVKRAFLRPSRAVLGARTRA